MLDWIGTKILALMTLLPAVFVDEKSPNFTAIRAMFGLGFIVLVAYLIACGRFGPPLRAACERCQIWPRGNAEVPQCSGGGPDPLRAVRGWRRLGQEE